MKNVKKLLALLLAVVMVMGMFPMSAAAEDAAPGTGACTACNSTEHTTENHPKCGTCNSPDHTTEAHPKCGTCNSPDHTTENHPKCGTCDSPDHTTEAHPKCGTCNSPDHTTEDHPKCGTCDSPDHTTENHPKCGTCGSTDHTTDKHPAVCEICKGDHATNQCEQFCNTCEKYPCECVKPCGHCGEPLTAHAEDCITRCICGADFKVHEVACPLVDGEEVFAYYEKQLSDLKEKAKYIADHLDKKAEDYAEKLKPLLDDLVAQLRETYGYAYDYYDADILSIGQDADLEALVNDTLDYLEEVYGYDYNTGILSEKSLKQKLEDATTLAGFANALKNVNAETDDLSDLEWGDVNKYIGKIYSIYKDLANPTNTDTSNLNASSATLYAIRDKIEENAKTDFEIGTISTIENDNINVHVFNYGAGITTQQSEMGFLPFSQGSYETYKKNPFIYSKDNKKAVSYEDMSEMDGEASSNGSAPTMSKTLVGGYPYITSDWGYAPDGKSTEIQIKAGSLEYLFDETAGQATGDTGNSVWNGATLISDITQRVSNTAYTINAANSYVMSHYAAKPGDSRLFKDANGYYYYNSMENAAWFNTESKQFEVYNTTVVPKYNAYRTNTDQATGNFLPFNRITPDTVGLITDLAKLKEPVTTNDTTTNTSIVRTYADGEAHAATYLLQEDDTNRVDLWFGVSADFKFNMPQNGLQDGEQMVYEFFGDDDVFVYIDGVLILSIGGCHAPLTGSINFATGDVVYEQNKNYNTEASKDTNGNVISRASSETITTNLKTLYQQAYNSLSNEDKATLMGQKIKQVLDSGFVAKEIGGATKYIFKDYTQHDFNFFYLERGGNISAMKMKFNMEPVPPSDLTLTKVVDTVNDALVDDQEYEFILTAENADGNGLLSLSYYVDENGTQGSELTTVEKTAEDTFIIKLKDGQTARFVGLTAGTTMSVAEAINAEFTSGKTWEATGMTFEEGEKFELTANANITLTCTNTRKTGSLSIEKIFEGKQLAEGDKFPIYVTIGDAPYTGSAKVVGKTKSILSPDEREVTFDANGVAMLKAGETLTITGIPTTYTYAVKENDPNGVADNSNYGYLFDNVDGTKDGYPVYTNRTGTIADNTTSAVTITNKHASADLKVIKALKQGSTLDDNQTFVFRLEGTDAGSNDHLKYDLMIEGIDDLSILDIPVGNYRIKELTGWSWRYELDSVVYDDLDEDVAEVTFTNTNDWCSFVLRSTNGEVTFTNKLDNGNWLSGDSYAKNWWGEFAQSAPTN